MIRGFCRLLCASLVCGACCHCFGQETSPPKVSFCELVSNPDRYNLKVVTVRATYKYGYEWSELYCLACLEKGLAWLEIPITANDSDVKALKHMPKGAGTVNITVQGTFFKCGHCGHENGYRFKFVATKATDVAVIINGMKSPEVEQKAEKQWACGGTNPK
jgi:hypothetical protein